MNSQISSIETALLKCWSIKTSSKWTAKNPYKGQCGVTSLIIQDILGGEILKTKVADQWHYYNRTNGQRLDLTSKQFGFGITYQDIESNRKEAFSDTNELQYTELKGCIEKELFGITDTSNTEHYIWGDACDGWHLVKSESLSVIKETMPPKTREQKHYHEKAQQFFYILSGVATFEINELTCNVYHGKGILIKPQIIHSIWNNTDSDLEFIVISEPKSHGDRINLQDIKQMS